MRRCKIERGYYSNLFTEVIIEGYYLRLYKSRRSVNKYKRDKKWGMINRG